MERFVNFFFQVFLFFVFPAEAVLLPCADALDISTVHIDDHAAHDGRTGHADDEVAHGQPHEPVSYTPLIMCNTLDFDPKSVC